MRSAILFVAVAACGGSSDPGGTDAAPHADGPLLQDVPPADAAAQAITVSVTAAGVPRAGVHVIVTKADYSDGGTFDTDATGAAHPLIEVGNTITAVDPFAEEGTNLYTVLDVQPGDVIELSAQHANSTRTAMAVTLPTFPKAVSYFVYTACGGGTPDDVELVGCGPTTPLLAVASDGSGNPLATLSVEHAAVGATLNLGAQTFVATQARTYAFANVPAGATLVGAAYVVVAADGEVYATSAAAAVTGSAGSGGSAGSATLQLAEPAAIGSAAGIVDASYVAAGSGGTLHHVLGTATSVDFASSLPEMSLAAATEMNVSWTGMASSGDGIPDGAIATVHGESGDIIRHVVGAFGVVLDTQDAVLPLPPVSGYDLSGAWTVLRLETAKAGAGEQALRQKAFAGDYAFATDGATSLVAEYKEP